MFVHSHSHLGKFIPTSSRFSSHNAKVKVYGKGGEKKNKNTNTNPPPSINTVMYSSI